MILNLNELKFKLIIKKLQKYLENYLYDAVNNFNQIIKILFSFFTIILLKLEKCNV